jgi:chorismate dehydratase
VIEAIKRYALSLHTSTAACFSLFDLNILYAFGRFTHTNLIQKKAPFCVTKPLLQPETPSFSSFNEESPLDWRVGWMSFLNTLPMRHGIETFMPASVQHFYGVPSLLNTALLSGNLDISLVSTAAYLKHQDAWQLLPFLSISSCGPVNSVLWIRQKSFDPLLHAVQCPDSSASSEALLRYILTHRYDASTLRYETYSHQKSVSDCLNTAQNALLIGDVALRFYAETKAGQYNELEVLDLASVWNDLTGHPFLFGVWCARKPFWQANQAHIEAWGKALIQQTQANLLHPQVMYQTYRQNAEPPLFSEALLQGYWCEQLDYNFTASHHAALETMDRLLR